MTQTRGLSADRAPEEPTAEVTSDTSFNGATTGSRVAYQGVFAEFSFEEAVAKVSDALSLSAADKDILRQAMRGEVVKPSWINNAQLFADLRKYEQALGDPAIMRPDPADKQDPVIVEGYCSNVRAAREKVLENDPFLRVQVKVTAFFDRHPHLVRDSERPRYESAVIRALLSDGKVMMGRVPFTEKQLTLLEHVLTDPKRSELVSVVLAEMFDKQKVRSGSAEHLTRELLLNDSSGTKKATSPILVRLLCCLAKKPLTGDDIALIKEHRQGLASGPVLLHPEEYRGLNIETQSLPRSINSSADVASLFSLFTAGPVFVDTKFGHQGIWTLVTVAPKKR